LPSNPPLVEFNTSPFIACTPDVASRRELKPGSDSPDQPAADHPEFVDVNKMQTSSASGMFLPGIYSVANI